MKLLYRYVLRELGAPMLIGSVGFLLVFQAAAVLALIDSHHFPIKLAIQIGVLKTPDILRFVLPSATAFAASLGVYRLSRDSEVIAMQSAGASYRRILLPVMAVGCLVSLLGFANSEWLRPKAEARLSQLLGSEGINGAKFYQLPNNRFVFMGKPRWMGGSLIFTQDLAVIDAPSPGVRVVSHAERATFTDGRWYAPEMFRRVYVDGIKQGLIEHTRGAVITQSATVPAMLATPVPHELTAIQLQDQLEELRRAGTLLRGMETELQARFSLPLASFLMAWLGSVLALRMGRHAAHTGLLIALVVTWSYFNVFVISTEILGRWGWVHPLVAAWAPNVLFGLIAVWVSKSLK